MSDTSMNPVPEKPINDGGGGNAPQTGTGSEPTEEQVTTESETSQESGSD